MTARAESADQGSAAMQGALWSRRAADWAEQEELQVPIYDAVLDALAMAAGARLLDVGCGSGVALREAALRGARVTGLDAAAGLVSIAARRVPEADVRVGDLLRLPFGDHEFDVVTGFNSFQFADDVVFALAEARRVVRPGGAVAIQVWGRPERTQLGALIGAIAPHLPFPLPSGPGGRSYCDAGVLEELATSAGLAPSFARDIECPFDYPDDETLLRCSLGAGLVGLAAQAVGEQAIRDAILGAMAPFRTPDGGYHTENEWHYLIARA